MSDIRLTVRVDFGADRALGPGKIRLLGRSVGPARSRRRDVRSICPTGAHGFLFMANS
jgi:hypothetical protein